MLHEPVLISVVAEFLYDFQHTVRNNAVWALGRAAQKGLDISIVIDELANALSNEDPIVKLSAVQAIQSFAENGDCDE